MTVFKKRLKNNLFWANLINCGKKFFFLCVLNKQQLNAPDRQLKLADRFRELSKNLSDKPKSKTFVYFTKISAATWSFDKIIPVFIALVEVTKNGNPLVHKTLLLKPRK